MQPRWIKSMYDYYLNLPQKAQVQVMTAKKNNSQIQWIKLVQAKAICCFDSWPNLNKPPATEFIDCDWAKNVFSLGLMLVRLFISHALS